MFFPCSYGKCTHAMSQHQPTICALPSLIIYFLWVVPLPGFPIRPYLPSSLYTHTTIKQRKALHDNSFGINGFQSIWEGIRTKTKKKNNGLVGSQFGLACLL